MTKMQELSEQMVDLLHDIAESSAGLGDKLSSTDKELVDIYHYIEMNNLSASAGYKAYKELQGCLRKRREIKEDIDLANILKSASNTITELDHNEAVLKTKQYKPRVREDLFPTTATKMTVTGLIIAKGCATHTKKQSYAFNSLDEAFNMIISRQTTDNYNPEKIKQKILKAARNNTTYDGFVWNIK